MSLYGKFSLGLVFLLIAGAQLHAQWGPLSDSHPIPGSGTCREIAMMVTDSTGRGIMGAAVVTDDSVFELRTDARGVVAIPCRSLRGMMPVVTVSAPGYRSIQTALIPDANSRVEVRLDRRETVVRSAGTTVDASELSAGVQKQSALLQSQAEKALAAKDYDKAEMLLNDALRLTPSSATISNNLGVIAMHRKDLDLAGSWFQKASELAPYKPEILGNLGLVRWMQHRNEESYSILIKAFSRGYESNLGHYILGTVGLKNGDSKDAANHLKKIRTDRFPYRDLYLSIALRNCGKAKAADETFQSFLRRHRAPFLISSLR